MSKGVVIPEHTLYNAVFPRILFSLMVSGFGDCMRGYTRKIGCGLWQVSHRFTDMLKKHLPKCDEPKCSRYATHYCVSGRPICCQHVHRIGFMHQIREDGTCLCMYREDYCLDIASKRWHAMHDSHNVTAKFWKNLLFVTFWHKGGPSKRFNVSYNRFKNLDDGTEGKAAEIQPMDYISVLYEFDDDVDEYIKGQVEERYKRDLKRIKI